MPSRSRLLLGLLATALACLLCAAPSGAYVYFKTEGSSVLQRADSNPRGRANVVEVPESKAGSGYAAVAIARDTLFYNGQGMIGTLIQYTRAMRQPIGGEATTVLRRDDFGGIAGLAADERWLYYSFNRGIGRARHDERSGPYTVLIPAAGSDAYPTAIAVDGDGVYWVTGEGRAIGRADLDGGNVRHDWLPLGDGVRASGLAAAGGHLYWIGPSADGRADVGRARIDGDRAADVQPRFLAGRGAPGATRFALAADRSGLWFWSGGAAHIGWSSLDGSEMEARAIPLGAGAVVTGMASVPPLPRVAVPPAQRLAFGRRDLGSGPSEVQTIPLRNAGERPLRVLEAELDGDDAGDFRLAQDCTARPVQPGVDCELRIAFDPRRAGEKDATVRVRTDAPGGTYATALSGQGVVGAASVLPRGRAFGAVRIGSRVGEAFVIENRQAGPLELGPVRLAGRDQAQFRVTVDGCDGRTLAPGQACAIDVDFAPSVMRRSSATLTVPKADGRYIGVEAVLSGTGVTPLFTVSSRTLAFEADDPLVRSVSIGNDGNAPLRTGELEVTGRDASSFSIVSDGCGDRSLAPGRSCQVEVAYDPAGAAPARATLRLADDAPGAPHEVLLRGEVRAGDDEPGQPGGGGQPDPSDAGGTDDPAPGAGGGRGDDAGRDGSGQDGGGTGDGGGTDGGRTGDTGRVEGGRGKDVPGGGDGGRVDGPRDSGGDQSPGAPESAPACSMVALTLRGTAPRAAKRSARGGSAVVAIRLQASAPARLLATRATIAWTTPTGRTRAARRALPVRRVGPRGVTVRWRVRDLAPGTRVRVRVATRVQPAAHPHCLVQPREGLRTEAVARTR